MADGDLNRVHERIDKVVDSLQRLVDHSHKEGTEVRKNIANLTTDVALLHEHLKNEINQRLSVTRPCPDHIDLARTVTEHLKDEAKEEAQKQQRKRLIDSSKARVAATVAAWLIQAAMLAIIGYMAAKLNGTL